MPKLIVIGGGYAGQMALARARALEPKLELVLIEPRDAFEERVRLHEVAAHGTRPTVALDAVCAQLRVRHVRLRAQRIESGRVWLENGSSIPFDAAIVALGSRSRPMENAHALDGVSSAMRLHDALDGRPVTVVGGGLTAIETATELAAARPDLEIELIRRSGWNGLSSRAASLVDNRLAELDIRVGTERHHHHHTIGCTGFLPKTLLGLNEGGGRVVVNDELRVSETIFVAGDMASPPCDVGMGCVSAMPMGAHAAANATAFLAGRSMKAFRMKKILTTVSLGGHNAVLDGSVVFGGRLGAWTKRAILAYTIRVWQLERATRWLPFQWPQPKEWQ